ncbi:MAG TPA: tetratricopeptide repeat protein [Polyangia bacterium]|nr:tetratricopeptide repeat protein [Polyangia bacterium]
MTDLQRLDDQPGPARLISDEQARLLVRGALQRVIAGDDDGQDDVRLRPLPATRRLGRVAVVLAVVLIGGAAVAGLATGRRLWPFGASVVHGTSSAVAATSRATDKATAPAENDLENGPPENNLDDAVASAPDHPAASGNPATNPPAATTRRKSVAPARPRALAHAPTAAVASDEDKPPASAPDAEDLLSGANQLRGQRRWREAAAVYQKVIVSFPETDGAYVAMLARAELLLDHLARPAEALLLFQRALARQPAGLLTEEARYGIAACYRAMGDIENERRALNAFLAAHPHSLLRASAAGRLAELH